MLSIAWRPVRSDILHEPRMQTATSMAVSNAAAMQAASSILIVYMHK